MRGEYPFDVVATSYFQELPPRARRIHYESMRKKNTPGTTSACAENTFPPGKQPSY